MTEFGGWKTGDKCRTVYLEDGKMYSAVITAFRVEARSAMVTFVGYLNQQVRLRERELLNRIRTCFFPSVDIQLPTRLSRHCWWPPN